MRRRYYRKKDSFEDTLFEILRPFIVILVLGSIGWALTHQEQIKFYGIIALGIIILGCVVYFVLKKRRNNVKLEIWDDDKILYMLKGMSPSKFEDEIASMFDRLGYKTRVEGGANDGGIDIVAHKDGKKYFVQCKKFMTREVTPHDVRDFLGAITNINNPAEKGFFVTTGNFTLMAEKAAEGNPRIELIDGLKLIDYYKLAYGKTIPVDKNMQTPQEPPKVIS